MVRSLPSISKGNDGEQKTKRALENLDFKVISNTYFVHNRSLCEVDLIAISRYGIFVIENKNYDCSVSGEPQSLHWQLNYSQGDFCYKLYNPLKQNKKHVNAVRSVLLEEGFSNLKVYNVVIFNNSCDLVIAHKNVFKLNDFVKKYNVWKTMTRASLSMREVNKIHGTLREYRDPTGLIASVKIALNK